MFYIISFAILIVLAVAYVVTFLYVISERKDYLTDMPSSTYRTICILLPILTLFIVRVAHMCWLMI